ncbi:TPA: hypothetical protein SL382_003637 [Pseudomonas aeruginosa]|uniref:hypothetical protein n=1 Tax=Pseudomonas aeruginosa TaxID=287 RepID=UPI0029D4EB2E|nr:hypothetical protein [Pseudomonas aeruginosa]
MEGELQFTRATILAGAVLLENMTQAKFDQMVQRLGLDHQVPSGDGISVPKKVVQLSHQVLLHPHQQLVTKEGLITVAEALIREAVALMREGSTESPQEHLRRCLARDGFDVSWDGGACAQGSPPWLRRSLPTNLNLPQTDNELHALLKYFDMQIATAHLDQAIDCHTRGDWAAANAQFRTFIEQLINDISAKAFPGQDAVSHTLNNRIQLLGREGFLSEPRGEWGSDGKGYIQGLLRMLHSEGSHPGISDEEHSTFKLHLTLITAKTLLRRLQMGRV